MKKLKLLFIGGSLCLLGITFTSCTSNNQEEATQGVSQDTTQVTAKKAGFKCPMGCQETIFEEPGACPICKMDMVEVDGNS